MSVTTVERRRTRSGSSRPVPPVRPVRTQADHDRAIKEVERLVLRNDLTRDEVDHLDVLVALLARYDDLHCPTTPDARPVSQRIKSLMESSGTTQAQLSKLLGSRSAASLILAGNREPSKTHIKALAEHFNVSPAYFL